MTFFTLLDVDHPGHNNSFEVQLQSSLALLYNDTSVLENHHLSLAFNIMLNKAYNIFQDWEKTETNAARKMIISCVLATDMAAHSSLQEELRRRASLYVANESVPVFDITNNADVEMLCKCVLHAADISNPTRPFRVSSRISMLAIEEFNQQAAKEKDLNMTISTYMITLDHASKCRAEIFFMQNIARPYFAEFKNCFCTRNIDWDPVAVIDNNMKLWNAQSSLSELRLDCLE